MVVLNIIIWELLKKLKFEIKNDKVIWNDIIEI